MAGIIYKVGMLVKHLEHPEWDRGKITDMDTNTITIYFKDGITRTFELESVPLEQDWVQKDYMLDSIPTETDGKEDEKRCDIINEADIAVHFFRKPYDLYSYKQLVKYSLPPKAPGVYAWYFNEIPPYTPVYNCVSFKKGLPPLRQRWALLYVGKATNLYERIIKEHFEGSLVRGKSISTLRMTIGALFSNKWNMYLWKHPRYPKKEHTFGLMEKRLSGWLIKHARIRWWPTIHHLDIEEALIRRLTLPLNIESNSHTFVIPLTKLRNSLKKLAVSEYEKPNKREIRKAYKKFAKEARRRKKDMK